jgi:hypothetical protein
MTSFRLSCPYLSLTNIFYIVAKLSARDLRAIYLVYQVLSRPAEGAVLPLFFLHRTDETTIVFFHVISDVTFPFPFLLSFRFFFLTYSKVVQLSGILLIYCSDLCGFFLRLAKMMAKGPHK